MLVLGFGIRKSMILGFVKLREGIYGLQIELGFEKFEFWQLKQRIISYRNFGQQQNQVLYGLFDGLFWWLRGRKKNGVSGFRQIRKKLKSGVVKEVEKRELCCCLRAIESDVNSDSEEGERTKRSSHFSFNQKF